MSFMSARGAGRLVLGAAILAAGLLTGPMRPDGAHAMLSTCRSDPTALLSNGAVVDLQAGIQDSSSDVRSVTYTLHAPVGTHVLLFTNTDGLLGLVEHFNFYANDAANTYDTYTVVNTGLKGVQVTASTTIVSALGLNLSLLASASGWNGQSLHVHNTSLL